MLSFPTKWEDEVGGVMENEVGGVTEEEGVVVEVGGRAM